jgi:hypothetical protein
MAMSSGQIVIRGQLSGGTNRLPADPWSSGVMTQHDRLVPTLCSMKTQRRALVGV